jgi:hypothetical protein
MASTSIIFKTGIVDESCSSYSVHYYKNGGSSVQEPDMGVREENQHIYLLQES